MPIRQIPLVNNEIYHVLNRGSASLPIFKRAKDYSRFIEAFQYYQNITLPMRFSKLFDFSRSEREKIKQNLKKEKNHWVKIIAYCLMPNHFHFLLKQVKEKGIYTFISKLSNSYSHYITAKYQRKGSLFEGRFKAIKVETEEQLLHLSRYIHLNPYSSYLLKKVKDLLNYLYSSFPEYLGITKNQICQKEIVLSSFSSPSEYKKFVFDHAEYQRELEKIKHLVLED